MPETATVLVVDDEPELREILSEYFDNQGLVVHTAASAEEARSIFSQKLPDLAILDIRMPGEDGLSLARWIRDQHKDMGIIMLTTAGDVVDRVVGLEMGADDYMPKPFDLRELLARVKSVLRRRAESSSSSEPAQKGRMRFGICEFDLEMHCLYDEQGNEKQLTAMEFDLLKVFAEHPNRALSRDQLMELAHNKDWGVFDRSIDLRIMRLRRKIEPNPEKPEVIKTVRGIGYMYVTS
ncbi:MAG: response regulator [Candidatus Thiodiazotropha taylori]|nr:response regulator [Candidatus Thiodiazotropha taylori]